MGASCLGHGEGAAPCPSPSSCPDLLLAGHAVTRAILGCAQSHLSAHQESAVISSVIKGLRARSISLKKQENNNNNDLCSGMLPRVVGIAFNAFQRRKLLTLQLWQIHRDSIPGSGSCLCSSVHQHQFLFPAVHFCARIWRSPLGRG